MLDGKVVVVTGGSRGIGAAIAKKFASLKCNVAVIYAGNEQLANEVCNECSSEYGIKASSYKCDVSDFEEVKDVVSKIKDDFETIDILVNNAGITKDGLIAMMKEADFDDVMDANLKGAFNMIRHTAGIFMKKRYGRIINISSVAGLFGNPGQINYSASKAGIIGLTKSVAKELGSRNITCNAVAPGLIATDMTKDLGISDEDLTKAVPLGKAGSPENVADAVAFLADSDYITGEILRVDGGMAM